jgi:hypothetical protein
MIEPIQIERADPLDLYARMRPDQRTAVANQFVRSLTLAGDDKVAELARETAHEVTKKAGEAARGTYAPEPPQMLSAEEVARMHAYAREHRPDVFERVLRHPVTQAALANPGARPTDTKVENADLKLDVDVPKTNGHLVDPLAV